MAEEVPVEMTMTEEVLVEMDMIEEVLVEMTMTEEVLVEMGMTEEVAEATMKVVTEKDPEADTLMDLNTEDTELTFHLTKVTYSFVLKKEKLFLLVILSTLKAVSFFFPVLYCKLKVLYIKSLCH